jgi:formamidopyrimidine-DNA glycosylase
VGSTVTGSERIGKRIVIAFGEDLFLVIHLMIAGRLKWLTPRMKPPGRVTLATFTFADGTLALTEAAKKKRASIHVVAGRPALRAFDRGGLDVMTANEAMFAARLRSESHTLKRSLTDPRLFDGIGNAYSDEILHRAQLSPLALSRKLDDAQVARLFHGSRELLAEWTEKLGKEAAANGGWPAKVTAFRDDMAVHGRYQKPCPVCASPVQRIRYAENETNYCATCQTGGRLLADRALSRLLRSDWPRSLDEYDGMVEEHSQQA